MLLSKIRQKFVLLCQNVREVDVEIPLLSGRLMLKYLCCQGCQCQNTFAVRDVNVKIPLLKDVNFKIPLLSGRAVELLSCQPGETPLPNHLMGKVC